MQLDPTLSNELAEKWKIPLPLVEKIIKEYKNDDAKMKFIQDIIESEWKIDDD